VEPRFAWKVANLCGTSLRVESVCVETVTEISHGFATFHAKRDSTQTYVYSFSDSKAPRRGEPTVSTHTLSTRSEVPHGFATFHAKGVSTQEIGGVGFSEVHPLLISDNAHVHIHFELSRFCI